MVDQTKDLLAETKEHGRVGQLGLRRRGLIALLQRGTCVPEMAVHICMSMNEGEHGRTRVRMNEGMNDREYE